jgi:hypothetical protein
MTIRKQNRCPACGNAVDLANMVYSAAADAFVCKVCLREGNTGPASEDDALNELMAARMAAPSQPPPPPTAEPPISYPTTPTAPSPRKPMPAWLLPGGIAAVLVVTLVIVMVVARSKPAADPRRAWEEANRERIIALKSQAEELTLQNKLKEAHGKYRELEQRIGGQQIGDPRLFDLVDQARLDQSRVYRMIMHSMSPGEVDAGPLPTTMEAKAPAEQRSTAASLGYANTAVTPVQPNVAPPASTPAAAPVDVYAASGQAPIATTAPVAQQPEQSAATKPVAAAAVRAPRSYNAVTDTQVEQAIRRGVDFLIAQMEDGQLRRTGGGNLENEGLNALAVYALLSASQSIKDERLAIKGDFLPRCIEQLKAGAFDPQGMTDGPATYAHTLRACAVALYNRPQDRQVLEADVKWLSTAATDGTYTYDDAFARGRPPAASPGRGPAKVNRMDLGALRPPMIILAHTGEVLPPPGPPVAPVKPGAPIVTVSRPRTPSLPYPPGYNQPPVKYEHQPIYQLPSPGFRSKVPLPTTAAPWDNSNCQYGVLGVWAGAEGGCEVPDQYWKDVQTHWMGAQLPSGQWSYAPNFDASYSMTVGGIATLLVAHDYLEAPLLGSKTAGRKPYNDFLTAGLAFLEHGDNVLDITQTAREQLYYTGYNLFGLERVGLASGLKYIGRQDWYVELSAKLLPLQHANGAWGRGQQGADAIIDTSYMLLFLARGRHPIFRNKLSNDGMWTNRPREIANLAAHAGRELERPHNWQVVDINHPPEDWADSPILSISGNEAPNFGAEEVSKIRKFIDDGGLLFTHADQGSDRFTQWAGKFAKQMFPGQALEALSPQHPLYSLNYKLDNPRPRLMAVDNGTRLLMVHSPIDLSNAWQVRAFESRKQPFQIGVNLYLYATGKERFRNRLDTRAVPDPPNEPAPQIDIAQVRYDGNWNPEPGAWPRFCKVFQNNTGQRLVVHETPAAELDPGKYIVATITGAGPRAPTDAELAPVAKFVRDGGTLFVDSCGGSGAFANAMEQWLNKLDPQMKLQPAATDDAFVKAANLPGGADLGSEQLRLYAVQQLGASGQRLKVATLGKGRIVYTPLDVTSGLLGTNTWGILGYPPEYAESLAQNVVLVTSARVK